VYARFGFLGALILAAALAACGGGGGGGGPIPTAPPPTPTPTSTGSTPTPPPSSAPAAVTFNGTQALPVAPGASYSGTITFPSGIGNATISASTGVPSATTELNTTPGRTASSARIASGSRVHTAQSGAPYTTTAYFTLTATSNVTISGIPTINASGYGAAFYNTQGFWVSLPQSGTITLASGGSVYFAIYTPATALPPPNPSGCVGVQPDATTRAGSAKAQLVGVQPITPGAIFAYTGTLTSTIVRATPCAIPTATANAMVTISVTTAPGTGAQVNEDSTETDAYSTNSVITNTDAVVEAMSSPAAQSFAELNETTTDEVGDSTVTTYASPLVYAVAAPLPFSSTITNAPPSTVKATLADGTTTNRTYESNGSYTEADSIPGGGNNSLVVNPDGSGGYNIDGGEVIFTYGSPSGPMPSGTITLLVSVGGGQPQPLTIPAWFNPNPTLYSDTTTDKTPTQPSQCLPAGGWTATDDFHRVISIIDPLLGYTETETIDSYVARGTPTIGPECVTISDVQSIYYDYNYDTPYIIYASLTQPAAPMQTNTINESYWYSAPPSGTASSTRTMSAGSGGLNASIAAHTSGIAFQRALERAQRIETLSRNLATRNLGGVK
jgi:hypothetical protein